MIRWTTPTLECEIEVDDETPELAYDYLILTIADNMCHEVNKRIERDQVVDNKFEVTLTEEETMQFKSGRVFAQLNFVWKNKRFATNIIRLIVSKNLYDKELIPNE